MVGRGNDKTNPHITQLSHVDLKSIESQAGAPWRLHVVGANGTSTISLEDGEHLIGRSSEADVRIDEDSLSRRHALLSLTDGRAMLQDVGSMNGTRVRERALRPEEVVAVQPGESFEVGKVILVLRRRAGIEKPRRRIYDHGYLETRLDEELERRDGEGTVTLARLHLDDAPERRVLEELLEEHLARYDLVGEYAPGELEVLFLDQQWDEVEETCEALVGDLKHTGAHVRIAFAIAPQDGRMASTLLASANAKLSGPGEEAREEQTTLVARGAMDRLKNLVERVARSDISIVLHGETGSGKEVMAREIHRLSERAGKTFVGLNCAALTETLLESELFGHERGAFSGAVATKPGLFEVAEKGTVFLDEIAEMSLAIQAKLLRVLEERTVLRVGGLHPRPIDVRFVAASHRDLEEEVAAGRFRQDLFFRLNGITLEIPPLRDRVDEIDELVSNFIHDACRRGKRADAPAVSRDAMQLLKSYSWPGNIRELRNVVERAVLLCSGPKILPEHLPVEKMVASRHRSAPPSSSPPPARGGGAPASSYGTSSFPPAHGAPHASPLGYASSSRPLPSPTPMHAPSPAHPGLSRAVPLRDPRDARAAHDVREARDVRDGRSDWDEFDETRPTLDARRVRAMNAPADDPPTMPASRHVAGDSLRGAVQDFERDRIMDALRTCGGNQTRAAEMLGISRRTLLNRLDQYGLPRPRK